MFFEKPIASQWTSQWIIFILLHTGLDETIKIVESLGGWCRGQIVDISKRDEVYKAAAEIKNNFGDVSIDYCQCKANSLHYANRYIAKYEFIESCCNKREIFRVTFPQCSRKCKKKLSMLTRAHVADRYLPEWITCDLIQLFFSSHEIWIPKLSA